MQNCGSGQPWGKRADDDQSRPHGFYGVVLKKRRPTFVLDPVFGFISRYLLEVADYITASMPDQNVDCAAALDLICILT